MKAKLEFDLNDEIDAFESCYFGSKFQMALSDILEHIRKRIKYDDLITEQINAYDDVRSAINEILKDNGVEDFF